jgi:peptidoglycan L-alanyl-D-glutamate endopeptidase CwlK
VTFVLPPKSIERLKGVHPDLVRVIEHAAKHSGLMFVVTEGERSDATQAEYFRTGKSKTMRSRHLRKSNKCRLSCAVDLAVWDDKDQDKVVDVDEISWKFPHYKELADAVKASAAAVGIPIEWGGDWTTFKDGPHFQLPWESYP